jgi:beta-barrel assembly-enhancing protease
MKPTRHWAVALLALALTGPGDAHAPQSANAVAGMLSLQALDQRVFAVGYRLAAAGVDFCPDAVPLSGMEIHVLDQYAPADRPAARAAFSLNDWPAILAVAPGGPADAAGIEPNDEIVAIDGVPQLAQAGGKAGYARAELVMDALDAAAGRGPLVLTIRRGDAERTLTVHPRPGCPSRFQTIDSDAVAARANGTYVEVSSGAVDFVRDDNELAAVIGHELAHNILGHRRRLKAAGVQHGLLQEFGRNARLTRETEVEADRLSVYLVDRAGYPTTAIVRYWTRYKHEHGAGIFRSPTHPGETERIATVTAEIARIDAMRKQGEIPIPAFLLSGNRSRAAPHR